MQKFDELRDNATQRAPTDTSHGYEAGFALARSCRHNKSTADKHILIGTTHYNALSQE